MALNPLSTITILPRETWEDGWHARRLDAPFNEDSTKEWKRGWNECDGVLKEGIKLNRSGEDYPVSLTFNNFLGLDP